MRKIKKIIYHCSASDIPEQCTFNAIKELHTSPKTKEITWGKYKTHGKAFVDIGYHFLIGKDGTLYFGRQIHISGAHCFGHNIDSIGICLMGSDKDKFTKEQFETAKEINRELCTEFGLGNDQIFGHKHFNKNKSCPNFDIEKVLPF